MILKPAIKEYNRVIIRVANRQVSKMRRSFKFYRKNEAEVMHSLGMKETKNSGSGWVEKEDGQNEYLICQLKSTDAQSIKINQKDIRMLEKNALVAHKIPVFAIQFLNTGEVWLMSRPSDIFDVASVLNGMAVEKPDTIVDIEDVLCPRQVLEPARSIKSSKSAREQFYKENNKKYEKSRSAT